VDYTDAKPFPIMPFYTANHADQIEAGVGGSNNFSNINSTLQAQIFAKALREYPSELVTPRARGVCHRMPALCPRGTPRVVDDRTHVGASRCAA